MSDDTSILVSAQEVARAEALLRAVLYHYRDVPGTIAKNAELDLLMLGVDKLSIAFAALLTLEEIDDAQEWVNTLVAGVLLP